MRRSPRLRRSVTARSGACHADDEQVRRARGNAVRRLLGAWLLSQDFRLTSMAPAAVPVTALPTFVSPEEHRNLVASTPASFNDIPPVLRHKEENVSVTLDPPLPEFSAEDCANGTLYVIERYVGSPSRVNDS